MALITCPECGRKVSDMATNCPDCGYPIAANKKDGKVRIRSKFKMAGTWRIKEIGTGNLLWSGRWNEVASFNIEEPTQVYFLWGINGDNAKPKPEYTFTVEAGKKYEFVSTPSFLGFTMKSSLNEIDVIDSD